MPTRQKRLQSKPPSPVRLQTNIRNFTPGTKRTDNKDTPERPTNRNLFAPLLTETSNQQSHSESGDESSQVTIISSNNKDSSQETSMTTAHDDNTSSQKQSVKVFTMISREIQQTAQLK